MAVKISVTREGFCFVASFRAFALGTTAGRCPFFPRWSSAATFFLKSNSWNDSISESSVSSKN